MLSQFVFGFAPTLRLLPDPPDTDTVSIRQDTTPQQRTRRSERRRSERLARPAADTAAAVAVAADTVATDVDTVMLQVADTVRRAKKAGLDKPISGKASDSLYYDLRNKMVYIYEQGDVSYGDMNLKADFMNINLDNKNIYAYGKADTVDGAPVMTRPVFTQGTTTLNMDTITYNIESQRAKIKSIATQQGDGWLVGTSVKKMEDNTINIEGGMYTTCDQTDHPHFYLAMTKAKVIPGKKAITGPAYLVMEDVPIYFLGVPEGFFPLNTGPKSGILMPTYGEEATRGFYIRGLGYYFTLSEHMDLALTGGIYTLGSWEANVRSRYIKRYKYSGNLNFDFSSVKSGDKGDAVTELQKRLIELGYLTTSATGTFGEATKAAVTEFQLLFGYVFPDGREIFRILCGTAAVFFICVCIAFVFNNNHVGFLPGKPFCSPDRKLSRIISRKRRVKRQCYRFTAGTLDHRAHYITLSKIFSFK